MKPSIERDTTNHDKEHWGLVIDFAVVELDMSTLSQRRATYCSVHSRTLWASAFGCRGMHHESEAFALRASACNYRRLGSFAAGAHHIEEHFSSFIRSI